MSFKQNAIVFRYLNISKHGHIYRQLHRYVSRVEESVARYKQKLCYTINRI